MKRTLSFMVMALALLLTQCRKPEVKFPSPVAPEGTTVSMTVTAGPGSKTDISETGAITWSTGDKLYVGDGAKYIGCLTLQGAGGSATGTFSGNVTLPTGTENGEKTFHFFYLGSGNGVAPTYGAESVDVSFATQEIYAEDGKLKNASKHHVGYGTANGTVSGGVVTGINVTLVSKIALAYFSFTKNDAPYTDELTLSGDNIYNDMTVNFGGTFTGKTKGNISLTGGHSERYVMLVPVGSDSETLNFGGGASGTTTLENGIEANKFYRIDGNMPIEVKVNIEFTVDKANGTTVEFAPGNLYYNGEDDNHKMNDTLPSGWNFYGHQWDCYPSGTESATASMEISMFTWGYGEWSTVYDTEDHQTGYGPMTDWGSVAIGSYPAGTWRTLTEDEWRNLLGLSYGTSPRDNAADLRAFVTLDNGVSGLVILPDGSDATASDVTTTAEVASSGAVFLPAAGDRYGPAIWEVGSWGFYWSSSTEGQYTGFGVSFSEWDAASAFETSRASAKTVRLVREFSQEFPSPPPHGRGQKVQ